MGNTILTVQEIARESLVILRDNMVFPNLVHQDYSEEFVGKGETIKVRKPAKFVGKDFDSTSGVDFQDVTEEHVMVKMDKLADVSFKLEQSERTLSMPRFRELLLEPAIVALAEKINNDGLALYKDIPYFHGTSGSTPDGLDDFAGAAKVLNDNRAPVTMRRAVWNPAAQAKFQILDALVGAEKSGSVEALREGSIGRVNGLDNFMTQAVKVHTAGLYTALADVTAEADVSAVNATDAATGLKYTTVTFTSAAGASTAKILKGDIMTIDGKQYVAIADSAAAVAGVVDAKVYPQIAEDIEDEAVTFADKTAGGHVANLAFHKNAFTFVTRPMELPKDKEAYVVSYGGVTLRIVIGYNQQYKRTEMSIDVLYGYKTLYPELATRVLG